VETWDRLRKLRIVIARQLLHFLVAYSSRIAHRRGAVNATLHPSPAASVDATKSVICRRWAVEQERSGSASGDD
jgi:hypothetical protein